MNANMHAIREDLKVLDTKQDRDSFVKFICKRNLAQYADCLDDLLKINFIIPATDKSVYHYGHLLSLIRLNLNSTIRYDAILAGNFDFEDVMLRRASINDLLAIYLKDDNERIQSFFNWFLDKNCDFNDMSINDVCHVKAVIDMTIKDLDPTGYYQSAPIHQNKSTSLLVHDLIDMQSDIDRILKAANAVGIQQIDTSYIQERTNYIKKYKDLLTPLKSPFLAAPSREMMLDERTEFLKTRNELLVSENYTGLIDHYDSHRYLFENEVERHAEFCLAIGHIYADLLKDSEKAADAFKEALEYDPSNTEAFDEVSRNLRDSDQWEQLVELLSNTWGSVADPVKRCEMQLECASIQAQYCGNVDSAVDLYERCMLEGNPGNCFDDLYEIIANQMGNSTTMQRMRALITLTAHVVSFAQCDKIKTLQKDNTDSEENALMCLSRLVDAGLASFQGDQPAALECVRDAFNLAPSINLIDGMMVRIASKMRSTTEFNEVMSDIDSDAIALKDLSDVLYRIATALHKLPSSNKLSTLAIQYAERAVDVDSLNHDAIDLCYEISMASDDPAKKLVFASLKQAICKDKAKRAELEAICDELKVQIGDHDDTLIDVYEKCLHFEPLRNEIGDDLRNLMQSIPDEKAVALLQHVESQCVANGLKSLAGELYESVLERNIDAATRKGLLERYLGLLNGQNDNESRETFLRIHAQLFRLSPSTYLSTLLEKATANDLGAMSKWTNHIEESIGDVDDKQIKTKLYATLWHIYQDILKDDESAATAAQNMLDLDPASVGAFKICFNCYERVNRFFDCCEICQKFPIDKFSDAERSQFCIRTLKYALLELADTNKILFAVNALVNNDAVNIAPVIDKILKFQASSNLDIDQLICFFEQMENMPDCNDKLKAGFKATRATLLVKEKREDDAIALFDSDLLSLYNQCKTELHMSDRIQKAINSLSKADQRDRLLKAWGFDGSAPQAEAAAPAATKPAEPKAPKIEPIKEGGLKPIDFSKSTSTVKRTGLDLTKVPKIEPKPKPEIETKIETKIDIKPAINAATSIIDKILADCASNVEDEAKIQAADKALETMSPQDKTDLCLKLGALYEANKANAVAEKYYKLAFSATQNFELLEFYKRIRKFKTAIKIANFKLANVSDDTTKASTLLDLAMLYEQIHDVAKAASMLDNVIDNYSSAYARVDLIRILRQKSSLILTTGDIDGAVDVLNKAAELAKAELKDAKADPAKSDAKKLTEDIDIDVCFILREAGKIDDARKKWQSLMLHGVKNTRMTLLNICFDIDSNKLAEAEKKFATVSKDIAGTPLEIMGLEQMLRISQKKENADEIHANAEKLLALDPNNEKAKNALG